ncbi:hypothetical protein ORV05_27340 [Amycolatopsis cynarae]|uniref:Alpha/beta hydrolase n=1 Tax=Amycolatopsis cynarae TaxID=2995223 RepID=A0ABY7BFT7_9PSEU|nr:hypothetical protein [Amycolatopsis sp. HUAS 11-8]WAL70018.1 hypothetical protein ORV05_27340 [Amycolatopsis sp. HUAS 11-8]
MAFPDGRVRPIDVPANPSTDPATYRTAIATRLADTRLVLDAMDTLAAGGNPDAEGRGLPENLGRALDTRRLGMYGHGTGGAIAAEVLRDDKRVSVAVNLEGPLDYLPEQPGQEAELLPVAREGVERPLLLFGTDGFRGERYDRSWSALLAHSGNHARRIQLSDANHWVFTDFGAQVPQLQAAGLMTAQGRAELVGRIPPEISVPAVWNAVTSFFTAHLP